VALSLDEIDRYERQMLVPGWGAAGQEALRRQTVRVNGRGPAATTAARYLAGAGVGRLVVEDEAVAEAAVALGPFGAVVVEHAGSRVPPVPGQPEPDPPEPADPDHPDKPAPDQPLPEPPVPEEPARVLVAGAVLAAGEDRVAAGAALAVEALKALLGLPFLHRPSVPRALQLPEDRSTV
jgi:ThiF family protein